MRRKGAGALIFFMVLTTGLVIYTSASGNSPLLGLDLQGGVSVVLQPSDDLPEGAEDNLDQAVDIIRNRVDALGVAEPDITRQGDTVLVQLPGVEDQDRALELVGQTAELRFRPVLQFLAPVGEELPLPTAGDGAPTTTGGDGTPTTTAPPATTAPDDGDEQGLGGLSPGENAAALQPGPTTTEGGPPPTGPDPTGTVPLDLPPIGEPVVDGPCPPEAALEETQVPNRLDAEGLTPPAREQSPEFLCRAVVLAERDDDGAIIGRYLLGPTALTGEALSGADAITDEIGTAWLVTPTFRSGPDGIDLFNAAATQCFSASPICPSTQLAIVLDSEVISAPQIQQPTFERDQIQITGDFDESSAKDLALVLEYGALPVTLEPQQTQTVSATLGEDSLEAGIIAGVIGMALTSIYMLSYYRLLGVVAVASLLLEFALLWSLIAYLGESRGLALTLAGVTGVIVAIGISLDSNVVFYENLKEDVRNGRTFRSTVERSFATSYSTIIKADVASLIGAGLLYWLSVGPVRGFALLLGIATLLDIFASWFFIRPAVLLLSRRPGLRERESWLGMPTAREVT